MVRRTSAEVQADAVAALVAALRNVLDDVVVSARPGGVPDLVVSVPGGHDLVIEVKGVAARAEPGPIANVLTTWDAQLEAFRTASDDVIGVVVAAAIPDATKAILRDRGWGWLDRRGELHLRAPGIAVHTSDVEPSRESTPRAGHEPIRGRAGITVAASLLLRPDDPPGVRKIARQGGLAPSSVSKALSDLRVASLVEDDGHPLVPELFWVLADAWKPERHAFAEIPEPGKGSRLALGLDLLDQNGWGVCSTVAAAAWSAPIVVASAAPMDFYVPQESDLRAAQRELQPARAVDERACTIAVAPTLLVVRPRYDNASASIPWLHWPLVDPLFVALDLAQDRARGVEILGDWNPPAPFRRVW